MSWYLAKSLVTLRSQVNLEAPQRKTGVDGTVSSAEHRARDAHLGIKSDHDPNAVGAVCAIDLTHDPHPGGLNSYNFAELLRRKRDHRLKYVISDRRIFSATVSPWTWRHYSLADHGDDPHIDHIHISVAVSYDDDSPWDLSIPNMPPAPAPNPGPQGLHFTNSGKGSWYSQFPVSAGSKYGWRDTGDKPSSNALHVPDSKQGCAFFNSHTLGQWFWVLAPNGMTLQLQQTDIGPAPWTGRKIDIAAVAAERFGYSPHTFPTNGIFHWAMA